MIFFHIFIQYWSKKMKMISNLLNVSNRPPSISYFVSKPLHNYMAASYNLSEICPCKNWYLRWDNSIMIFIWLPISIKVFTQISDIEMLYIVSVIIIPKLRGWSHSLAQHQYQRQGAIHILRNIHVEVTDEF